LTGLLWGVLGGVLRRRLLLPLPMFAVVPLVAAGVIVALTALFLIADAERFLQDAEEHVAETERVRRRSRFDRPEPGLPAGGPGVMSRP
jgi:hypothetical protein